MDLLNDLADGEGELGQGQVVSSSGAPSSWRPGRSNQDNEDEEESSNSGGPLDAALLLELRAALDARDARHFGALVTRLHGRAGVAHYRENGRVSVRGQEVAKDIEKALQPLDQDSERFVLKALGRDMLQHEDRGPAAFAAVKISSCMDGWEKAMHKNYIHPGLMDGCLQTTAYTSADTR
mmetsp:Transcript_15107/g.32557  ORF Transcript_15107/g.32557 Transcript_15107/m.32557 type:complete len:180 (+) Transcript_15107:54-593(+)